jgi:CBS domain containing-hemolysin-like protein
MTTLIESAGVWLPGVLAMALLIAASAFFSASETALFYLSREELRRMQSGNVGERLVASLMRNPDRLLTVVLFWNLIVNLTYFTVNLALVRRLVHGGQPAAAGVLSLLGLVLLILFGEVGPKSIAVVLRRQIAVLTGLPLSLAARALDPVLPILSTLTQALRRMLWPNLKQEPYLELDDIERAVENSELGVELVHLEQQILGRILELSDMTAEELMRPRGTYRVWQPPIHLSDLHAQDAVPEFLLIAGEDRDTVTRALTLYDMTNLPERDLDKIAEPVIYVPWCATVSDTLAQLRHSLASIASVVNEYGETVGILSEDDILDTLFNPLSSRGKRLLEREPIVVGPDGRLMADGLTTLRNLANWLELDYDVEEDDAVTVSALIHDHLERFPQIGDVCLWQGYRLKVIRAGEPGDPIEVSVQKIPGTQPKKESAD